MPEHAPPHSPHQGPALVLQNRVTSRSVLNYIDANYQQSSHSLADTQCTTDSSKHNWRLGSSHNLNMDAAILSRPHLPRTSPCYYLQAGDPHNPNANTDTSNDSTSPPLIDDDDEQRTDTLRGANWRVHAHASGRAGSYYDYSTHAQHLRDRLFFQAQLLPPDVALQGATTQALQDYAALELENKLLERVVGEKEEAVQELRALVREREEGVARLVGGSGRQE